MILGFSNGNFYSINDSSFDRFSAKQTEIFELDGRARAIELHASNKKHLRHLLENVDKEQYSFFDYISLHAPTKNYQNNKKGHEILTLIEKICKKWPIKNIVLHPDAVKDWEIFLDYKDLPWSLENIHNVKDVDVVIQELKTVFQKYPFFKFTFDLQHLYIVDPHLQSARKFYQEFADRLVEYHISSYDCELIHGALFKNSKQDVIIKKVYNINVPIIIESAFVNVTEVEQEFSYINQKLKLYMNSTNPIRKKRNRVLADYQKRLNNLKSKQIVMAQKILQAKKSDFNFNN